MYYKRSREDIINSFPHDELLRVFFLFAKLEVGLFKMDRIISDINSSDKIKIFIYNASNINSLPGADDYLYCLHSSTRFFLKRSETMAISAILLLTKWNYEVGKPKLLSVDASLNRVFFTLMAKCRAYKININRNSTFFDRFNEYLQSEVNQYFSQLRLEDLEPF